MISLLSSLDIALLIGTGIAIVAGLIIFFLVGIYRVKKDYEAIIEKAGEYYTTLKQGVHFKMPVVYQRVALYCVAPQVRSYTSQAGNKLSITFQIEDSKKYHYSGLKFETIMALIEKENSEINLTDLQNTFSQYGLKFINIKKADY